jgi:hypothetical protein
MFSNNCLKMNPQAKQENELSGLSSNLCKVSLLSFILFHYFIIYLHHLPEDPSLGTFLCSICPEKFKKTEHGTYTWAPPGSSSDIDQVRKGSRRKLHESHDDDDEDADEAVEVDEVNEEELKEAKARGERIMAQLKEKQVQVPV